MKKSWDWVKKYSRWILIGSFTLLVTILVISWGRKNSKIRRLEHEIALLSAKMRIERLAWKNEVLVEDLNELKEKDVKISDDLVEIEERLRETIPEDMTAAEIAAEFRKIGL